MFSNNDLEGLWRERVGARLADETMLSGVLGRVGERLPRVGDPAREETVEARVRSGGSLTLSSSDSVRLGRDR